MSYISQLYLPPVAPNGCVKGDTWCQRGGRIILTRVVGVKPAVWPMPSVWQKRDKGPWGAAEKILLKMESRSV